MGSDAATGAGAAAPLVTGEIVISASTPPFRGATVHVRLEDVSYADRAAAVIAEAVIRDVRHEPRSGAGKRGSAETRLRFALHAAPDAAAIDPRNDYAVRAWVDRDGDGKVGPGDLFSDQSHPVLTRGFGREVTIVLGPR